MFWTPDISRSIPPPTKSPIAFAPSCSRSAKPARYAIDTLVSPIFSFNSHEAEALLVWVNLGTEFNYDGIRSSGPDDQHADQAQLSHRPRGVLSRVHVRTC